MAEPPAESPRTTEPRSSGIEHLPEARLGFHLARVDSAGTIRELIKGNEDECEFATLVGVTDAVLRYSPDDLVKEAYAANVGPILEKSQSFGRKIFATVIETTDHARVAAESIAGLKKVAGHDTGAAWLAETITLQAVSDSNTGAKYLACLPELHKANPGKAIAVWSQIAKSAENPQTVESLKGYVNELLTDNDPSFPEVLARGLDSSVNSKVRQRIEEYLHGIESGGQRIIIKRLTDQDTYNHALAARLVAFNLYANPQAPERDVLSQAVALLNSGDQDSEKQVVDVFTGWDDFHACGPYEVETFKQLAALSFINAKPWRRDYAVNRFWEEAVSHDVVPDLLSVMVSNTDSSVRVAAVDKLHERLQHTQDQALLGWAKKLRKHHDPDVATHARNRFRRNGRLQSGRR